MFIVIAWKIDKVLRVKVCNICNINDLADKKIERKNHDLCIKQTLLLIIENVLIDNVRMRN